MAAPESRWGVCGVHSSRSAFFVLFVFSSVFISLTRFTCFLRFPSFVRLTLGGRKDKNHRRVLQALEGRRGADTRRSRRRASCLCTDGYWEELGSGTMRAWSWDQSVRIYLFVDSNPSCQAVVKKKKEKKSFQICWQLEKKKNQPTLGVNTKSLSDCCNVGFSIAWASLWFCCDLRNKALLSCWCVVSRTLSLPRVNVTWSRRLQNSKCQTKPKGVSTLLKPLDEWRVHLKSSLSY